jgi:aromatic-L-amino-acid decarboxylase
MSPSKTSLDTPDWHALRGQGHRMLDGMFDHLEHVSLRPVWQPIPDDQFPYKPEHMDKIYAAFRAMLLRAAASASAF